MRGGRWAWLFVVTACGGSSFATGGSPHDGGAEDGTAPTPPPIGGEGGVDGASGADGAAEAAADAPADSADATLDAGADSADASADATLDQAAPTDTSDDTAMNAADASCPPVAAGVGVFVRMGGSSSSGCGSQGNPCGTVQLGITTAAGTGMTVFVAPGSYPESLILASGVTVSGGWSASWTRTCDPTAVKITTTTSDRVAFANNLGGGTPATLDTLTLANDSVATTGQSLYGVFVVGSFVKLTDVLVTVAAGGAGSNGLGGSNGGPARPPCSAGTGASGTTATLGMAGTNGTYAASGFVLGSAGTGGGNGTAGADGTAPGGADCDTTMCFGPCNKETAPDGCTANSPPQGGCCSGAGTSGCGGSPGTGGGGGSGGGSSIALFAWGNAEVSISGGSLASGNGGAGGMGGAGGSGTMGTAGAAGDPYTEDEGCATGTTFPACATAKRTLAGGAAGGMGGNGTGGGAGGGGAGGDSYAYYADPSSTVTPGSDTMLVPGSFGAGGSGGTAGPNGNAGPTN